MFLFVDCFSTCLLEYSWIFFKPKLNVKLHSCENHPEASSSNVGHIFYISTQLSKSWKKEPLLFMNSRLHLRGRLHVFAGGQMCSENKQTNKQKKEEVLLCGWSFIQLLFLSFSDGQCSVNTRALGIRPSVYTLIPLSLSSLFVLLFRHNISPSGLLLLRLLVGYVVSRAVIRGFPLRH